MCPQEVDVVCSLELLHVSLGFPLPFSSFLPPSLPLPHSNLPSHQLLCGVRLVLHDLQVGYNCLPVRPAKVHSHGNRKICTHFKHCGTCMMSRHTMIQERDTNTILFKPVVFQTSVIMRHCLVYELYTAHSRYMS